VTTAHRVWVFVAAIVFSGMRVLPVRADDVDSPQYAAWAKFKVGSSETLAADITAGPNAVHVEMTQTLVSVADDQIEIESVAKVEANGHSNNPTPIKRTIKSKAPATDVKETGTQDVKAMDKTFSCKVLELTGDTAVATTPRAGSRQPPPASKVTLYVNSDVPGGLVKLESLTADGKTTTFVLSAMDVK
jgi:hypothetical protein